MLKVYTCSCVKSVNELADAEISRGCVPNLVVPVCVKPVEVAVSCASSHVQLDTVICEDFFILREKFYLC